MNLYNHLLAHYSRRRGGNPARPVTRGLLGNGSPTLGAFEVAVSANSDWMAIRYRGLPEQEVVRVSPDGSFHFLPIQSIQYKYMRPSESSLLYWLTNRQWHLARNKRVKHEVKFGYYETAKVRELLELSGVNEPKRIQNGSEADSRAYWNAVYAYWYSSRNAARQALYEHGVWSQTGEIVLQRIHGGKWVATPTIPAAVRVWVPEARKVYRERTKKLEQEFELRTRLGAFSGAIKEALNTKGWYPRVKAEEIPTEVTNEALREFTAAVVRSRKYYLRSGDPDLIVNAGKAALQRNREAIRRSTGAVVYSRPELSQPSS